MSLSPELPFYDNPVNRSITMLGRLLSTAASTFTPATFSSRNPTVLESVTEEEHTSSLLFPDASLLRRSNTAHAYPLQTGFNSPITSVAGAYDDRGGMELDPLKDFRVIIAQNAIGDRDEPCLLLDTRASTGGDSSPKGLGLEPQLFNDLPASRHARTSSLSKTSRRGSLHTPQTYLAENSPASPGLSHRNKSSPMSVGAFTRARGRSSTFLTGGLHEHLCNRSPTDSSESGLLNCIFGSSAFNSRGSSTKLHILSTDSDAPSTPSISPAPRENEALVTPRPITTRAPMARTYSSGTTRSTTTSYFDHRIVENKPPTKVTILLTRMFSVNLPEGRDSGVDGQNVSSPISANANPEAAFPFPDVVKRRRIKEKKTPMYAVAITVQIPLSARNNARPLSRLSGQTSDTGRLGETLSFSLDSDHRWNSVFLDDPISLHSPSGSNLDDRIDILMDHWDVITRTLSHLERLASREILHLLKRIDALSAPPPKPVKAPNMQRTNQTIVQLPANILAGHTKLREEVLLSAQRICFALRIPRVVVGQSRWGVWREEARWIARSLADKEHSFFFLVLITAFLGNHTEWLSSLGPEWYRKRHYQQQKSHQDLETLISNRTVIISADKTIARRLIFLLSAFLPAKQRFDALASPLRPGTSASVRPLSQSPPGGPFLRKESLRRTINRRAQAQRLNLDEINNHQRSGSVSSSETALRGSDDIESISSTIFAKGRRESDARSVRTAGLPIHPNDGRLKNSSTATTSTTAAGTAVPVPHFTSRYNRGSYGPGRGIHDSTDSDASANLLRNLRRSETSDTTFGRSASTSSSRLAKVLSGLWGTRPEVSAPGDLETMLYNSSIEGSEDQTADETVPAPPPERSLEETGVPPESIISETPLSDTISIPTPSTTRRSLDQETQGSLPHDQPRESPLKLSVRSHDGIVDVDLPLPGFVSLSSSGDSTLASPKKPRTSMTSVDALPSSHSSPSNFAFPLKDTEGPPLNVAGWLKAFHEDFLLQAVQPYNSLETDVRHAMSAEPLPPNTLASCECDNANATEKWFDIATTLIADTRTCTVKRLRLQRKITPSSVGTRRSSGASSLPSGGGFSRQIPEIPSPSGQPSGVFGNISRSRKSSINGATDSYTMIEYEEQFIEEQVMDLDGTLVDAVERVLVQSGHSSLTHSRTPSPHRVSRNEDKSILENTSRVESSNIVVEIPRGECRKMVLGALEEVVRSVAAEHAREDEDSGFDCEGLERGRERHVYPPDNTLREGVRKWLLEVEEAC